MTNPILRMTASSVVVLGEPENGKQSRVISGMAVPWDVETTDSLGTKVLFQRGSLPTDGRNPRLIAAHDSSRVLGVVSARVDDELGMLFDAELAHTRDADDQVELLKMGALDSVSVGAIPTDFSFSADGVMIVAAADWPDLSIVAVPAFEQSRVTKVAAATNPNPNPEGTTTMTITQDPTIAASVAPVAPVEQLEQVTPTVQPVFAAARQPATMPSPVEYITAALAGGFEFEQVRARVQAAAPDVTTTANDGVLPIPVVGSVYDNYIGARPVIDSIGVHAMPASGKVFTRPYVTTRVSQAVQSAENAALTAGEFQIGEKSITKAAYGGYVTLSEQIIDWSDPAIVGLLLEDMAKIYAGTTENIAADALLAAMTQTLILTDPTSATEWVADLYTAASTILTNSNGNMPTHLYLAPGMWASLGSLVDSTGRPLFPAVGPMNAAGTMSPSGAISTVFGLIPVVSRWFAANTVIIGDPSGFEIFEQQKGAISVDVPSTLSKTVAWRGYFATVMMDATKFVSLT